MKKVTRALCLTAHSDKLTDFMALLHGSDFLAFAQRLNPSRHDTIAGKESLRKNNFIGCVLRDLNRANDGGLSGWIDKPNGG
jgi:hypothetical protein